MPQLDVEAVSPGPNGTLVAVNTKSMQLTRVSNGDKTPVTLLTPRTPPRPVTFAGLQPEAYSIALTPASSPAPLCAYTEGVNQPSDCSTFTGVINTETFLTVIFPSSSADIMGSVRWSEGGHGTINVPDGAQVSMTAVDSYVFPTPGGPGVAHFTTYTATTLAGAFSFPAGTDTVLSPTADFRVNAAGFAPFGQVSVDVRPGTTSKHQFSLSPLPVPITGTVTLNQNFTGRALSGGTTHKGSTAISSSSTFAPGDAGNAIAGAGIPKGTIIASVTDVNDAVMSQAANVDSDGAVTFTLAPDYSKITGTVSYADNSPAPVSITVDTSGNVVWTDQSLKAPGQALPVPDGGYLVTFQNPGYDPTNAPVPVSVDLCTATCTATIPTVILNKFASITATTPDVLGARFTLHQKAGNVADQSLTAASNADNVTFPNVSIASPDYTVTAVAAGLRGTGSGCRCHGDGRQLVLPDHRLGQVGLDQRDTAAAALREQSDTDWWHHRHRLDRCWARRRRALPPATSAAP